jgi:hypothetical protein
VDDEVRAKGEGARGQDLLSGLAGVSDWFGLVHLTKAVVRH